MKTAMQELIDEMTKYLDLHESPEVKEVLRILKASAIRKYWKKEKEQICNAYTDGLEGPYIGAEEYYNQTYKQKSIDAAELLYDIVKKEVDELNKDRYNK
jgi:hypothetical protein